MLIDDPWGNKNTGIDDPFKGQNFISGSVPKPDMASVDDPWSGRKNSLESLFTPQEAPPTVKSPTMAGEFSKGIMQGLYQMKEMGGGLLALTGEALKSVSSVMEPIAEPIKGYGIDVMTGAQKDMKPYEGAVPSYKNIGGVQDALYYLSHGVGTFLPMVGMSMVSGGIGAAAGKAIAKNYVTTLATQLASRGVAKETINEAVKKGLLRGLERGALLGGYASSLAMEAGSITADVVREKQEIEPGRIMAGALPAAALDVLPEFSLIKRTGLLQRLGLSKLEIELTEEAVKKVPHSFLGRIGKEAGKQFLMEAPTEAMQSVLERWAERKDLTAPESIDDYIDSFLIGGAGGALFGGLGGAFEKRPTPKREETLASVPGAGQAAPGVAPPPEIPPPAPPATSAAIPLAPGPAIPPVTPEVAKPPVVPQEVPKAQPPSSIPTPEAKPALAPIPAAPAPEKATIAVPPKEEIARGPVAEKPAAPAAAPEAPKPSAKEPWEMTREEYLAQSEDISQMRKLRQEEEGLSLSTPKDKRFATTALNAAIRNEKGRHEESVRKAMAEGKPIPTEVLTDYPDLAPKAPIAVPKLEPTERLAIETKGGGVLSDPKAKTYEDLMKSLNINEREVESFGKRTPFPQMTYVANKSIKLAKELEKELAPKAPIAEPTEPNTLIGWIRSKGGIWDESTGMESFKQKESGLPGLLSKEKGRTFDELAKQAIDEGWLDKDSTGNDLMELLKRDISAQENKTPRMRKTTEAYPEEHISKLEKYFEEKAGVPPALNAREIKSLRLTEENVRDLDRLRFDSPEMYEKILRSFAEETERAHEAERTGKKYQGKQLDMFGDEIQGRLEAMKEEGEPKPAPKTGDFVTLLDDNGKPILDENKQPITGKIRDDRDGGSVADVFTDRAKIQNPDRSSEDVPVKNLQIISTQPIEPSKVAIAGDTKEKYIPSDGRSYQANEPIEWMAKETDQTKVPEDIHDLAGALLAHPQVAARIKNIRTMQVGEEDRSTWQGKSDAYYLYGTDKTRGHIAILSPDFAKRNPEQAARAYMEEVIHGLTENMSKQDKAEFQAMLDRYRDSFPVGERDILKTIYQPNAHQDTLNAMGLSLHRDLYYASQNVPEFIGGMLKNKRVQDWSRNIPDIPGIKTGGKSLWDRFTTWMNRVVWGKQGGDEHQRNLLRQVLEKFSDVMTREEVAKEPGRVGEGPGLATKLATMPEIPVSHEAYDQAKKAASPTVAYEASGEPRFVKWAKQTLGILSVPNKDLTWAERMLSLPQYLKKRYPIFGTLMDIQTKGREHPRSQLITELQQAASPFLLMKGPEVPKVDKALIEGNRNKVVYEPDELRDPKRFGLSDAGIEAYMATRTTYDAIMDRWMDHAENSILRPFVGTLSEESFNHLKQIFKEKLSPEAISLLDPELAKAYQKIEPGRNIINDIRARVAEMVGYVPQVREPGKYYATIQKPLLDETGKQVMDQNEKPIFTTIHSEYANNSIQLTKLVKAMEAGKGEGESVVYGRHTEEPESTFFHASAQNLQRLIDNSLATIKAQGQISEQQADQFRNTLATSLAQQYMSRGMSERMIKRAGHDITGYKETGMQKVLNDYIMGYAGMETKANASYDFMQAMKDIPKNQPKLFQGASDYVNGMLRNYDRLDEKFKSLKGMAYLYYLGGSLRFGVLQATQNFVTGMPVLAGEMKKMGIKKGIFGAERVYIKAMKDIARGNLTEEEKFMDHEVFSRGISNAQMMNYITGQIEGSSNRAAGKVAEILAYPGTQMEIFNRRSAALAMGRLLREKGVNFEDSINKIDNYINNTHYEMTRANLPLWAMGGGLASKIANVAYTFRRFNQNYILAMLDSMKGPDGRYHMANVGVFMRSLAWLTVFGGMTAAPFLDDLMDEAEKLFGKPYRQDVKNWMKEVGGTPLEKMGVAGLPAMLGQIPGMVGADISGSLKLGLPSLGEPGKAAQETALGVWGGILHKGQQTAKAVSREDYLRAAEFASPIFIENILKALRMTTMGATTPAGKPIVGLHTGKKIQETTGEGIVQGLGFKPERIGEESAAHRTYQNVEKHFSDEHQNLLERFRLAQTQEDRQKVLIEIQKYNLDASKYRGAVPLINAESLRRSVISKPEKHYQIWGAQQPQ